MSLAQLRRLAALGAVGVAFGVFAIYALIAFAARHTRTGGIDTVMSAVTWISVAVPAALIIAVHLVFARILFRASKGEGV